MRKLVRHEEGIVLLLLILFLLSTLSLGLPLTAYGGDGIGQPSDGLNSTPPSGGGGTSSALETLVLNAALTLVI